MYTSIIDHFYLDLIIQLLKMTSVGFLHINFNILKSFKLAFAALTFISNIPLFKIISSTPFNIYILKNSTVLRSQGLAHG